MFDRIQKIGTICGNNNLIINGDVVVNGDIVKTMAELLLRQDLQILSQEAREEMLTYVNECVQKILKNVLDKKLEEKLTEFARPSTQWIFYSTLKGYTQSETQEQRDMLVDSLIDRMQEGWNSTERMIIDSAINIIPKLTPSALSTLGVLQLRHQIVMSPIGPMIDQYFTSLVPLVELMSGIGRLETEYLKQERMLLPLPGLQSAATFEQHLLTAYDLFFRKPLAKGVYEDYCKQHPEAHEAVTDNPMRACMMWVDATNGDVTSFCCPSSKVLKKMLIERHQEYIIPHVDALMGMMPPFTEDEVKAYFVNQTRAWERLFRIFSTNDFTKYTLSITGNYIGGKILAKTSHGKALPLSSYTKEAI